MGWFTNKPATPKTPTRVHSIHLSDEPSFTHLAATCITAAGPDHTTDPVSVLTGIYTITTTQVSQWFTALGRPRDGQAFERLFTTENYTDQHLWDYLTGDGGKITVHNNLAELLNSEQLKNIITTSLQEGHHNHP